jgi:hypothetical protein
MIDDRYWLDLNENEFFALVHILDEWRAENPHLTGPCVQFVDTLTDKVQSKPYPEAAAETYQMLIAEFEAKRLSQPAIAPEPTPYQDQPPAPYRCPACEARIDLGPAGLGGFCFTCMVGRTRESLCLIQTS